MTLHALELTNFPVYRGQRLLVKNISAQLPAGRFLELTGPNGCGKTSLLRTLASIQDARLTLDQNVETCYANSHSATGHSHLSVFYFGHQTGFRFEFEVIEQLSLSLQMHGSSSDKNSLETILKRVGLNQQRFTKIAQLSQGQLRRLMLAIMAYSGCDVWLIDEPLNALDLSGIALLGELLVEHLKQGGAALIATHQPIELAIPALQPFMAGKIHIEAGQAQFFPTAALITTSLVKNRTTQHIICDANAFFWVLRREVKLIAARPQDMVWPALFYWMTISLFPFGMGADTELLARAAGGIFWVSALLASLIGMNRFFNSDYESGALNQLKSCQISLSILATGKIVANWLFLGIPLALTCIPLGLLYGLSTPVLLVLCLSLLLGSISLASFSGLFAALGLMARQAQIIICLLAFPIFVPLVVFGTAAVSGVQNGIISAAPLIVLMNLALLSIVALPVITGRVLALALE